MSEELQSQCATALDAMTARVETTLEAVGDEFPYYADPESGEWTTTPDGDWCSGHWLGLLWLAAEHSEEPERYRRAARRFAKTAIDEMPAHTMFRGLTAHYVGFGGYDQTGSREYFGMALGGADDMVELYDEEARQIPLGEFDIRGPENFRGVETEEKPSGMYIGAVDNIYTALPILWRAYEETGDPQFRDVAISHADRHLDWYIRDDGSTWHHAVFDEEGALLDQYNELAHSDDSCWARGQGWNIAGLAVAHNATNAERYLSALEQTTEYYVENSPADLVSYWDFDAPDAPDAPRDTSAAALAAYGLLGLELESKRTAPLRETGEAILESLLENYLVHDEDDERYGMVTETCYNKPGEYVTQNEVVWTDYYLAATVASYLHGEPY